MRARDRPGFWQAGVVVRPPDASEARYCIGWLDGAGSVLRNRASIASVAEQVACVKASAGAAGAMPPAEGGAAQAKKRQRGRPKGAKEPPPPPPPAPLPPPALGALVGWWDTPAYGVLHIGADGLASLADSGSDSDSEPLRVTSRAGVLEFGSWSSPTFSQCGTMVTWAYGAALKTVWAKWAPPAPAAPAGSSSRRR